MILGTWIGLKWKNNLQFLDMNLDIIIKNREISLILRKEGKKVDESRFPEDHNLSRDLLPAIDKILVRNKLEIKDVKKARLISDIKEPYTSYRIAKAIVNGISWG
jgi:hypothetical protein